MECERRTAQTKVNMIIPVTRKTIKKKKKSILSE